MSYNLANLPKDEMDEVSVDLVAGGVGFKKLYNNRSSLNNENVNSLSIYGNVFGSIWLTTQV